MPTSAQPREGFLASFGSALHAFIMIWGDAGDFALRTLGWLFMRLPSRGTLTPNFYQIGVRSVPVVGITGLFIGMVLGVQSYGEYVRTLPGMKGWMGVAINSSVIRELGPVLAATMLAGRVGCAIAAELGTMRVTEQIDALWCVGANPIHYLVVPRFLACVFLIPLLTVLADFMGVMGGALIAIQYFGIEPYQYWSLSRRVIGAWDLWTGIAKSMVFGGTIALISAHRGFNSSAGAEGVGKAATEAFVLSFVAILILDFFLAVFFNTLYAQIWPR